MSEYYLHATQIVEQLSGEKKVACLRALQQAERGDIAESGGAWDHALVLFMKAHDEFIKIPEARTLLGAVKNKIAAAYGNLGYTSEARRFAQEALQLPNHPLIEALAHMTLGNTYYADHDAEEGARNFGIARQLLMGLPGAEQYLQILESNEARFRADQRKTEKKPWQFWK